MDAMELLLSRASAPKLVEPAPEGAALARILEAALRAPDHGALGPFRVLVVRGEARRRLGDALAEAAKRADPACAEDALEAARAKPLRAPLLFVVTARVVPSPKVPAVEQLLCAGAAAHALLLALEAEGFGGIWRTGPPAYDPTVKAALGLEPDDAIVAFVYAGTPAGPPPAAARPTLADRVAEWRGPGDTRPLPGP